MKHGETAHRCCGVGSTRPGARPVAGSIVSAGVIAFLPKCPACIAAYLAMGTGIGIATSTAAYLRLLLLFVCVAWLAYGAARLVLRWKASGGSDRPDGPGTGRSGR